MGDGRDDEKAAARADEESDEVEVADDEADRVKGGPRTTAFLVSIA